MKTINQLLDMISEVPEDYRSERLKGWQRSLLKSKVEPNHNGNTPIANSVNIEFEIQECKKDFKSDLIN